ncbi:MAG: hypothetical protein NTZ05_14950 [Chloroflexi bacterium]|nr:hypothetical protein [Chloroflexota bacterium]
MLNRFRVAMGTAAASLMVGALAVGTTFAAPTADAKAGQGKYADTFVTQLASLLHVDKTVLTGDIKQAASATVDAAVTAGDMTQAQADKMKARIQTDGFPGLFGGMLGGHGAGDHKGGPRGGMMGGIHSEAVQTALAAKLGLTTDQLKAEMKAGKTLHAIGVEKGVSDADLKAVIVGVVRPELDKAVTAGKMTQAQADAVIQKIQAMDLDQKAPARGDHKPGGRGEGQNAPGQGRGHRGQGQGQSQG